MKIRTVLCLDRTKVFRDEIFEQVHHAGFRAICSTTLNCALKQLDMSSVDILIMRASQLNGPGKMAYRLLRVRNRNLFTILICEPDEIQGTGEFIDQGVDTVLVANFLPELLEAALFQAIETLGLREDKEQLKDQLARTHRHYRNMLNQFSEGVVVVDRDLQITFCNESFLKMINASGKPLLGNELHHYIDDGFNVLHNIFHKLTAGKKPKGYRVRIKPDYGDTFEVNLSADFQFSIQGYIEGMLLLIENRTLRDEAFVELVRIEKLQTIKYLANTLAHEINNPVNVISGRLQIFQNEVRQPGFAKSIDIMHRQLQRISKTVRQMQRFNQSKEDNLPALFPFAELLERFLAEKKSDTFSRFRVDVSPQARGVLIQANPIQMEDAILYLCRTLNALLTGSYAILLQLQLRKGLADMPCLELSVDVSEADFGSESVDIYQNLTPPKKGSILDIALTHTIITNYGGKIYIDEQLDGEKRLKVEFHSAGIKKESVKIAEKSTSQLDSQTQEKQTLVN